MTRASTESDGRVMVFAKAPVPGEVKTRLIPALGAARAAELHRRLVERTVRVALDSKLGAVELWCAPDLRHPFFGDCAHRLGVSLWAQGEGDLGARMHRAFERALATAAWAVIVGSDIPELDQEHLGIAARDLRSGCDAVLGPARDGGYVLIGLTRAAPEVFRSIQWGGPTVLGETRKRLAAMRWNFSELPELWDVDRPEDLAQLAEVEEFKALASSYRAP